MMIVVLMIKDGGVGNDDCVGDDDGVFPQLSLYDDACWTSGCACCYALFLLSDCHCRTFCCSFHSCCFLAAPALVSLSSLCLSFHGLDSMPSPRSADLKIVWWLQLQAFQLVLELYSHCLPRSRMIYLLHYRERHHAPRLEQACFWRVAWPFLRLVASRWAAFQLQLKIARMMRQHFGFAFQVLQSPHPGHPRRVLSFACSLLVAVT